jgi:hypothetical protein
MSELQSIGRWKPSPSRQQYIHDITKYIVKYVIDKRSCDEQEALLIQDEKCALAYIQELKRSIFPMLDETEEEEESYYSEAEEGKDGDIIMNQSIKDIND